MTRNHQNPLIRWATLLLVVLILGGAQRLFFQPSTLPTLHAYENGSVALLKNLDGYFYLRSARDLSNSHYYPIDEQRNAPFGMPRREPAPALSRLIAGLSRAAELPLEWTAAVLPASLAIFIAIPVFLIGCKVASPYVGFGAALLAVVSPFYSHRTGIGWLDTDCLVVTLVLAITAALLTATKRAHGIGQAALLVLATLLLVVFFEWWDQAPGVVLMIGGVQFGIAILLFSNHRLRDATLSLLGLVVLGMFLAGPGQLSGYATELASKAIYVLKQSASAEWPVIGNYVSEQSRFVFFETARMTAGSPVLFLLGVVGTALFMKHAGRQSLLLLLPLGLGLLSLIAARFWIFLSPILALGIAYLAWLPWSATSPRVRRWRLIGAALYSIALFSFLVADAGTRYEQPIDPGTAQALEQIGNIVPRDAIVWSDWEKGYPIQYWSKRATLADGALHGGERSVYLYLPLASSDFGFAGRFMTFFAARGMAGPRAIREAVGGSTSAGLDALKAALTPSREFTTTGTGALSQAFLYPRQPRPIYLFLNLNSVENLHMNFMLGRWDPVSRTGAGSFSKLYTRVAPTATGDLLGPWIRVDMHTGIISEGQTQFALRQAIWHGEDPSRKITVDFPHQNGLVLDYWKSDAVAFVFPEAVAESVFFQLYFRNQGQGVFEKVDGDGLQWQLWRLLPDPH